ncbi:phage antirepressor [Collinsella tanakaei]|uniref:phage antirepressor n=1 Tax=Collinsella tanakaei TaxID=626935 RepID=UPI00248E048C|nr:phage antirepressor KilAC domain-containing protein [Collinsella tanakaei]
MQEIVKFENENFGSIRVTRNDDGEPLFVAKDILDTLGLDRTAMRKLDDDEKGVDTVHTPGGDQQVSIVSEPGFYKLVMRSRKPEAKAFQRWVTHEVLPSIRKRGGYMASVKDETPEETMARAFIIAKETIERKNREIAEMKPKALFADAVSTSDKCMLVGELAKVLRQNGVQMGQKRLFAWLRDNGYLMKRGSSYNLPTQKAMEMELFEVKETAINHSDGHVSTNFTTKVTPKGQQYFINKFLGE